MVPKMSKSYGNTIEIFSDEKTMKKKIMSIQTGSESLGTPLDPDTCLVIQLHKLFGNQPSELSRQSTGQELLGMVMRNKHCLNMYGSISDELKKKNLKKIQHI